MRLSPDRRRRWEYRASNAGNDEFGFTDIGVNPAAAKVAGLKKKLSPHWLRHAHGPHAHQRGAPGATIRDSLGHASLSTTDLYLSSSPTDGSSLYLKV